MRKKLFVVLILNALFMPLLAQSTNQIIQAFNKGDVNRLYRFLGEDITLILDKENYELKKQDVKIRLTDFFRKNTVSSFELKHQGDRNGSAYLIGTLFTSSGEFRLSCFFKKTTEGLYIHRIRIEK